MTIHEKIKDKKSNTISIEKQQKTALSSGKIDKYEYLKMKKYYLLIKVE